MPLRAGTRRSLFPRVVPTPSFIASAVINNGTTGTAICTVPVPAGVLDGDLLVAVICANGGATVSTPAGWALVRRTSAPATSRSVNVFERLAASEPVSYDFAIGPSTPNVGVMLGYRRADVSEASSGQGNAATAATTAPALDTLGPNRLLVHATSASPGISHTPPPLFTERFDGGGTGIVLAISDGVQAAAGSTGAVSGTLNFTSNNPGALTTFRPR